MNRYARQMILPEIGAAGQARLAAAHVLVIGAGGLGCPVLQYLAGAGIGQITLLDPDAVEESNLHRQPIYTMADLGRPKALAARDRLRDANPQVQVHAQQTALHPGNADAYISAVDLVIDAADSFALSYTLSDRCHALGKPLISASVLRQGGYAGGFCGGAPSLRAVFPDLPASGANCATAGVLGPAVGMIGALQAQMAMQVVLDQQPSPLGRMVTLDLQRQNFGGFSFAGALEPAYAPPFLSLGQLRPFDRVIELRPATEAPAPITPDAIRIMPPELDLPPDATIRTVLCCASGLRAWRAANVLRAKGHANLALLAASACG